MKQLTKVLEKTVAEHLTVRGLEKRKSGVSIFVRVVVLHGGTVAGAMQHDAVLSVVVYLLRGVRRRKTKYKRL